MVYEHDHIPTITEVKKEESKNKLLRTIFFTIIWILFINGCLVIITISHFHPTWTFAEVFYSLPDYFFWNFNF
jgi:hypothetical protein